MGTPVHDAADTTVEVHADEAVVNTAPDGGGVDNASDAEAPTEDTSDTSSDPTPSE